MRSPCPDPGATDRLTRRTVAPRRLGRAEGRSSRAVPSPAAVCYPRPEIGAPGRNDMNQGDLAAAVAAATGAKRGEAAKAVEAVLDAIRDGLQRDGKVALTG